MPRQEHEKVLILNFGGQYARLIARRVRDQHVFCEVHPHTMPLEEIRAGGYRAVILSGGPASVYLSDAPKCEPELFELGIPVLGICYGAHLMAQSLGGQVHAAEAGEYGSAEVSHSGNSRLFEGVSAKTVCWMSHTDRIVTPPEGFEVTAWTDTCPVAAMENTEKGLYAVQLHPEVSHTAEGAAILHNFLYGVAGLRGDWTMSSFVSDAVKELREKIGTKRVLCALSGGVDSAVCAALLHRAIGDGLTCLFVDHGLLRKNEADMVEEVFNRQFNMKLIKVDAQDRFLDRLSEVTDPERKRKIIGEEFIRVFEENARTLGHMEYLAQGTIYPDVIESGEGGAATIKSHHNVGGLPFDIDFEEIIEPLRPLFKDEVRVAGLELGLPKELVWRQPFPGPGLAVRVLGAITREKLHLVREADAIFREEIAKAGLEQATQQYFAVLTGARSVGVMGDGRTYGDVIALRAVTTTDFMTADWARLPDTLLATTAGRIVNEVPGIGRVVYDITAKPPGTIEWE